MAIELPKDAEGREIPLDTVVLFNARGDAFNIVRWIYTTDFETWAESNKWRAIVESSRSFDPELMYLTPPDSWEKLEEDLDRCIAESDLCWYYSPSGQCLNCAISDNETRGCTSIALGDIKDRIRKLRGEGDAD